jgi:hypothetical protein
MNRSEDDRKFTDIQFVVIVFALIFIAIHLIWPSLAIDSTTLYLLLAIFAVLLFPFVKKMSLPGGVEIEPLDLDAQTPVEEEIDVSVPEEIESSEEVSIHWGKVATLFWLGNDLMWIQDMTYRGAAPERVRQGVLHALQYSKELGFEKDSTQVIELFRAKDLLDNLVGINLKSEQARIVLEQHYGTVRQYVQTTKWIIDGMAKREQPDFVKLRALKNPGNELF